MLAHVLTGTAAGRAPAQMGTRPRLSSVMAMAQPITSWMSLPMMAISAITHSAYRGARGYSLLRGSISARHVQLSCWHLSNAGLPVRHARHPASRMTQAAGSAVLYLQCSARCLPVATPSFAASICMMYPCSSGGMSTALISHCRPCVNQRALSTTQRIPEAHHERAPHEHPEEAVVGMCARLKVAFQVAWVLVSVQERVNTVAASWGQPSARCISAERSSRLRWSPHDVGYAHQEAWPSESPQLAPGEPARRQRL